MRVKELKLLLRSLDEELEVVVFDNRSRNGREIYRSVTNYEGLECVKRGCGFVEAKEGKHKVYVLV